MERFEVSEKLGEGVLASVYKVIDKKDQNNKPLVLKEIECLDVTSAKNALEEFRLYHSFKNPSVCKIHDCFIKWENKMSSIFVCYTMDYFEEGSLIKSINANRLSQQIVPLDIIQSWLGCIIDGMYVFHKNGLIHRNLKPSSLYLKTINGVNRLEIGDFGPYVIMKDVKTSTRVKQSVFNYQAPEIIDAQDFDMKSDVWTIGTTLLDMCTTGIYDQKTFQMHLLNIRHDGELLKKILKYIHKIYNSTPLLKIIKYFLCAKSQDRVSLKSIIHLDFVQQCLHAVDSELVDTFIEKSNKNVMLPKEQTVKATVAFIKSLRSEKTAQAALERLVNITENQEYDITIEENQNCLFDLMKNFPNNTKIQTAVLNILEQSLVSVVNVNMKLRSENVDKDENPGSFLLNLNPKLLETFFYLFLNDNKKDSLFQNLRVILHLSHFERIVNQLASFKIIKYLLEILNKNVTDPEVVILVCKTIWYLASNDNILKSFYGLRSLETIRNVLITFQKDVNVIEMASNVVIALTLNGQIILEEVETDLMSAILIVLENHLDSPKIVRSSCIAISMMINLLEESAFRFVYLPSSDINNEISGIDLLTEAYHKHKDKSEIVLQICNVFKELCKYDEMLVEMKSINLHENLMVEISQRFRDNVEITEQCTIVIKKIEERIKQERENEKSKQMKTTIMWKKLFKNPAIF